MMPLEEATKKKHKLFPFNIVRKRSSVKAKGKSKSLVDLYDVRDGQPNDKRSNELPKNKRLSHYHAVNSSSDSQKDEGDSLPNDGGEISPGQEDVLILDGVENERLAIDGDEIDPVINDNFKAVEDLETDEFVVKTSTEVEPGEEEDPELPVEDMGEAGQPKFPPGTTVCTLRMNALPYLKRNLLFIANTHAGLVLE